MPHPSKVPHRVPIGRGLLLAWKLPRLSLEWKLPLIMIAVFSGGLAALLVVTYATFTARAEGLARDRLSHAAAEVARGAGESLAKHADQLRSVADSAAVRRALSVSSARAMTAQERSAALAELRTLILPPDSLPIDLRDREGRVLLSVGRERRGERRPPVPLDYRRDSSVRYSGMNPVYEDTIRFWAFAPVTIDGEALGWVARAHRVFSPPDMARTLREMLREDVTLYLRDANGGVWSTVPGIHVPAPIRWWRTSGGLQAERQGIGITVAEEATVRGTSWFMVLESPLSWIEMRARPTIVVIAWVSLALVILGAVLSWMLSRQITRPISALSGVAERIARGDDGEPEWETTAEMRARNPSGDEIARLAVAFDEMSRRVTTAQRQLEQRAADAESGNRAKSAFLAMMSHELRTPLNAISGYAELLDLGIYGPINDAQRDALRRIGRSQEHLLTLIDDVLGFARIEAGRLTYSVEEIPLAVTLSDVDSIIAPQAQGRHLDYRFQPCDPNVLVRADADKLRQVLLNLLANAIKYNSEGGLVALGCDIGSVEVLVHVTDTGAGIPSERLEHIFEPFVQATRAFNRPDHGVGLGLAISRELAIGMGARLTVKSEVGMGSTFTVILPRSVGVAALDGPRAYAEGRLVH
jgi:signal transduction histidine kinase